MHLLWIPPSLAGRNTPSQVPGEETVQPSISSITQTRDLRSGRRRSCSNSLRCWSWVQTHSPVIPPTSANVVLKEALHAPYPSPGPFIDTLAVIPQHQATVVACSVLLQGALPPLPSTKPHNLQLQLQQHIGQGFPEASSEALNTSSQGFSFLSVMEKRSLS